MNMPNFSESLQSELRNAIPEVLGLVSGLKWEAVVSDGLDEPAAGVCKFGLNGPALGTFSLVLSVDSGKKLGSLFLGATSAGDELSADDKDACAEACRQVVGLAMDRLRTNWPEVNADFQVGDFSPEGDRVFKATFRGGETVITFSVLFSDVRYQSSPEPQNSEAAKVKTENSASRNLGPDSERNLGLLLDINLAVTLRFGRRELLLKDVLELASGSVLELDREVHEPVDLLLNDRVIARGEVVIVDGNYGLRVSEIPAAS